MQVWTHRIMNATWESATVQVGAPDLFGEAELIVD